MEQPNKNYRTLNYDHSEGMIKEYHHSIRSRLRHALNDHSLSRECREWMVEMLQPKILNCDCLLCQILKESK